MTLIRTLTPSWQLPTDSSTSYYSLGWRKICAQCNFIYIYLYVETEGQLPTPKINNIKLKKTHAHTEGARDPSGVRTLPWPRNHPHKTTKDNPQDHQAKDHPHPTGQGQPPNRQRPSRIYNYLPNLLPKDITCLPIPLNVEVVTSTKHIPSPPIFIKTLEHSYHRKLANLNLFKNPLPCRLGIYDELVPNAVFNPGVMSLFIVTFNPNGPKSNVPN